MITTVTTVTTTVVGLTAVMSIAAIVSLIALLTARELANASGSGTSLRIARFVSVGIVPLVMAFAVIVALKIAEVVLA